MQFGSPNTHAVRGGDLLAQVALEGAADNGESLHRYQQKAQRTMNSLIARTYEENIILKSGDTRGDENHGEESNTAKHTGLDTAIPQSATFFPSSLYQNIFHNLLLFSIKPCIPDSPSFSFENPGGTNHHPRPPTMSSFARLQNVNHLQASEALGGDTSNIGLVVVPGSSLSVPSSTLLMARIPETQPGPHVPCSRLWAAFGERRLLGAVGALVLGVRRTKDGAL